METKKTEIVSKMNNEQKRIELIARKIFLKNGFHKTSMDEIAKELKVSKKTLYKYFSTKEELIRTIQTGLEKEVRQNLEEIISSKDNTIVKLRKLSNFISDLFLKVGIKWAEDLSTYYPQIWSEFEKRRSENIVNTFARILSQGKKENLIVDKPNELIVQTITSGLQGVINPDFLIRSNYSLYEAFNITFDILISGILTKKGRKQYKEIKKRDRK